MVFIKLLWNFFIFILISNQICLGGVTNQALCNKNIKNNEFKLGLENISKDVLKSLRHKRLALITNQTGIDSKLRRNVDALLSKGLNLKAIYVPEHGFDGKIAAEKKIEHAIDKRTKIPIISLYEGDSKFKKFSESDLDNIDGFIFDIQDSGIRHYTYISILYRMMEVADNFNKKFVVLDRPNPLGIIMEGPLVEPEFTSFISIAPIPLRHAMTIGELAKYFRKFNFNNKTDLLVVPMQNYLRSRGLNNSLPIYLSPNIKNINACLNYSFLGILGEINPISVLVGTKNAFCCVMLPIHLNLPLSKWNELRVLLAKQNLNSYIFKYFKEDTKQDFVGLKLRINNINKFSNMHAIITILEFLKKQGIKLSFSKAFSKVMGTAMFQQALEDKITLRNFAKKINKDLIEFFDKTQDLLIYYPKSKIKELIY